MTRDPVERYVSAFHSKVKCCSDNKTRCYQDLGDDFVPGLSTLAKQQKRSCLNFDEYIGALESVHRQGKQHLLNDHFKPQTITCFVPVGKPTLVFDVTAASAFFARLRGFKLHSPKFVHSHSTPRDKTYDTTRLQALACPEYKFVDQYGISSLPPPSHSHSECNHKNRGTSHFSIESSLPPLARSLAPLLRPFPPAINATTNLRLSSLSSSLVFSDYARPSPSSLAVQLAPFHKSNSPLSLLDWSILFIIAATFFVLGCVLAPVARMMVSSAYGYLKRKTDYKKVEPIDADDDAKVDSHVVAPNV
jgi:hypothetical protein